MRETIKFVSSGQSDRCPMRLSAAAASEAVRSASDASKVRSWSILEGRWGRKDGRAVRPPKPSSINSALWGSVSPSLSLSLCLASASLAFSGIGFDPFKNHVGVSRSAYRYA